MKSIHRRVLAMGVLGAAFLLAACGGGPARPVPAAPTGTVKFALPPGQTPSYVFPLMSGAYSNNINIFQLDALLYPPIYWFGHNGQPSINYHLSIARPPVFSNGGRTVTITLKHDIWSDGRPVTNRDVEFWMRLLFANKADWLGYVPGSIPDDVTAMSFPKSTPQTFSLTFNRAYSHLWLLYNQLSQIEPMPQHAWDKTSMKGRIGNYDRSRRSAVAVYNFLNGQSRDQPTYASNPLWKVVDGPWEISAYSPATGYVAFTPNRRFVGTRSHIAHFEEIPFTSDTAEFNALRAGQLDYGYIPAQDLTQSHFFTSHGYGIDPWVAWGFNALFVNYTNPKVGPMFKQLYLRQAMQRLIDQTRIIRDIYRGAAFPTYGPVPVHPANSFVSSVELHNPYPFSIAAARALLAANGWAVHPSRIDTCVRPGTGHGECGAGIARGAQLNFSMVAANGSEPFDAEMQTIQSDWSLAGIHITLSTSSPSSILSIAVPCNHKTQAGCTWQIVDPSPPGGTPTYSPEYLPTGEVWFATGGNNNISGYSNKLMDAKILATTVQSSLAVFKEYENYVALQLPELWQPSYYYQDSVISKRLKGALPQDPNLNIYPQTWTLSR
ncbi:MAG TPA: ABC transporter substrate-binding protein [Candidatus Micrarchaeia archaeon]|nr:ABC transporter substrate-binding protein [Candidatus Micrarchaeia archaeon]